MKSNLFNLYVQVMSNLFARVLGAEESNENEQGSIVIALLIIAIFVVGAMYLTTGGSGQGWDVIVEAIK